VAFGDTTVPANLTVEQWQKEVFLEYNRQSRYFPFTGSSVDSVVYTQTDLTKMPGDTVTIPLVANLTNAGVTGNTALVGSEEILNQSDFRVAVDVLRNAVVFTEFEKRKPAYDMDMIAKRRITDWFADRTRDALTGQLRNFAVGAAATSTLENSTDGERDIWLGNNEDRALFGSSLSNLDPNDFSDSILAIDIAIGTNGLRTSVGSLARLLAQTASGNAIRPMRVKEEQEFYVMFCNPNAFRSMKQNDTTLLSAQREALPRSMQNILFQGGSVMYDGILYVEIPENSSIPKESDPGGVANFGNVTNPVAANFLCGAQALAMVWAETMTKTTLGETDYQFRRGIGGREIRGIEKVVFDTKQHGVVTVYTSES